MYTFTTSRNHGYGHMPLLINHIINQHFTSAASNLLYVDQVTKLSLKRSSKSIICSDFLRSIAKCIL